MLMLEKEKVHNKAQNGNRGYAPLLRLHLPLGPINIDIELIIWFFKKVFGII